MQALIKHIRITAFAVMAAFLLALIATTPVRGQAATDDNVTVVLHKLVFDDGNLPESTSNDGKSSPFGDAGTPLNDVTFKAYDVTAEFWAQNPKTEAEMEDAQNALAASDTPRQEVATEITSGAGTATFTLPRHSGGQYAVYLFRETAHPSGVSDGQNLVLVLPVSGTTNQVDLYPKDEATVTPVTTGGQQFVKIDADDHSTKLAGAQFVVRSRAGKYLRRSNNQNSWEVISGEITTSYKQAKLLVLTSDSDGQFAINGLRAGQYELVEVKAPDDYVRSSKAVAFTVTPGKFSSATDAIQVANVHETVPPDDDGYPPLPDTGFFGKIVHHWHHFTHHIHHVIKHLLPNTFGGMLPQTGGARAIWLTLLGIFILLSIAITTFHKKSKPHEGE